MVVQFSRLCIVMLMCNRHLYSSPELLSSCKTETLYPSNNNSPHLSPLSPWQLPFYFVCRILTTLLLLLLSHFSRVRLCATPETAAHQAPPSLGFSGQEHGSGLQSDYSRFHIKVESYSLYILMTSLFHFT